MKKKVLVIAHDFPPFAGGGIMRIHKFVKYFFLFNVEPYIVTIKSKNYETFDFSLLKEYSDETQIFRTNTINIKKIYNFFKRKKDVTEICGVDSKSKISKIIDIIQSSIFIPDYKILWLPFALFKSYRLIKKYKIKNLLTTSPPHSVQLTGLILKKLFPEINWIVDFRDLWTDYNIYNYPFSYIKKIEKFLEKKVINSADKIFCATNGLIEKFKENASYNIDKFELLTNGYDPQDFSNISLLTKSQKLKIMYSGSLNDWRNLKNFIKSLEWLFFDNEDFINKIEITLCGHIPQNSLELINLSEFSGIFKIIKLQEHKKSINMLAHSDIVLLIIGEKEGKEVLTGKIFEYIGSCKPILGIVPKNGEAYNLIKNNNIGYVADTTSIKEIYEALKKIFVDFFDNHKLNFKKNDNLLKNFSRINLTEKICKYIK